MNPALWAAKTGLDAQQTRMTVTSHNLANVATSGFKKGRAVFGGMLTGPPSLITGNPVPVSSWPLGSMRRSPARV